MATNVHRKELVLHRRVRILCVRIINLNFQGIANVDRHGAQHRAVSCQVVAQLVSGDLGARKCRRSVPDGVRRGSHRAASRVDGGSGSVRQRSRCRSLHLNLEGELDLRGVGGASLRVSGNTGVQGTNVVEELGGGSLKRESLGDHAKGLGSSEVKLIALIGKGRSVLVPANVQIVGSSAAALVHVVVACDGALLKGVIHLQVCIVCGEQRLLPVGSNFSGGQGLAVHLNVVQLTVKVVFSDRFSGLEGVLSKRHVGMVCRIEG